MAMCVVVEKNNFDMEEGHMKKDVELLFCLRQCSWVVCIIDVLLLFGTAVLKIQCFVY